MQIKVKTAQEFIDVFESLWEGVDDDIKLGQYKLLIEDVYNLRLPDDDKKKVKAYCSTQIRELEERGVIDRHIEHVGKKY